MAKLKLPNYPPDHGLRVPAAAMSELVTDLFIKVGMPQTEAAFTASLLVQCDLRCVFSHGTRHAPEYMRKIREGKVNPRPEVRVVEEAETTAVVDGDGGLGFIPSYRAAELAISKAVDVGTGAATTRNHFHFGSAGIYSRMGLEQGCIGMAFSSVRYPFKPEDSVLQAAGASPISVAVPAGEEPPLVLDMAANMLPHEPELMQRFPKVFFKSLGIGAVLHVLGGVLAGIWRPELQSPPSPWEANQGSFVAFFSVSRFMPIDEFRREMDNYIGKARRMQPFPGTDRAVLPGGMEWHWERENRRDGIPVSSEHQEILESMAAELQVETPFSRYESLRF
jgi:L-2-hydroxycarboxylate dehydrogenase (NAD+)